MKKIYRKINKKYIILFSICLFIMVICALNETNLFYIVKQFVLDKTYRENFTLAESDVQSKITLFQVIKQVLTNYSWKLDYMLIFGTNFFQILLPCIVSIFGVLFYIKYNSIYNFAIHKTKNYKKFILKEIFIESMKVAITIYCSYLAYYLLLLLVTKGSLTSYMGRTLFIDILGNSFYNNYTYFYYILDGFVRLFLIPFIYTFFSCTIATVLKTQKQVFLGANIYYYGLSAIGFGLYYIIGQKAIYFNPSVIMASGTYSNLNTLLLVLMSFIPLVISYLILWRNRNVEL